LDGRLPEPLSDVLEREAEQRTRVAAVLDVRRLFDDVEFSYLVVVAAELGVADLLAPGPRLIADLPAESARLAASHP
jgi:hypothetical protein